MPRLLIAAVSGGIFGAGLLLSGMTDTDKVRGFLDLFGSWDPTLAFVMGGALAPMAVAWRLTRGRKPMNGDQFPAPPDRRITRSLLTGATLFGIGWGLVGLCPGPALAALSFGGLEGVMFVIAMVLGMLAAPPIQRRLDSMGALA